jgi:uncharacterized protein YqjF (DUF2071 family)
MVPSVTESVGNGTLLDSEGGKTLPKGNLRAYIYIYVYIWKAVKMGITFD